MCATSRKDSLLDADKAPCVPSPWDHQGVPLVSAGCTRTGQDSYSSSTSSEPNNGA